MAGQPHALPWGFGGKGRFEEMFHVMLLVFTLKCARTLRDSSASLIYEHTYAFVMRLPAVELTRSEIWLVLLTVRAHHCWFQDLLSSICLFSKHTWTTVSCRKYSCSNQNNSIPASTPWDGEQLEQAEGFFSWQNLLVHLDIQTLYLDRIGWHTQLPESWPGEVWSRSR